MVEVNVEDERFHTPWSRSGLTHRSRATLSLLFHAVLCMSVMLQGRRVSGVMLYTQTVSFMESLLKNGVAATP